MDHLFSTGIFFFCIKASLNVCVTYIFTYHKRYNAVWPEVCSVSNGPSCVRFLVLGGVG